MDRFKIIEKNELEKLPKTTGVYAFFTNNSKFEIQNSKLECIYIGKAINIQGRVKNHFNQPSYRDNLFIEKVDKIGFFETNNSEIEALILEANLIKKYQPKFNVVWKDGKNYFYVAVARNNQNIPYIFITHQPNSSLRAKRSNLARVIPAKAGIQIASSQAPRNDGTIYIGPFVEGTALKKTLRFLRRVFPYYTTTLRPGSGRAIHPKTKCTYCHLDLCPGPNPNLAEYRKNIKKLVLILRGKRSAVLNSLKKEMSRYARSGVARKNYENHDFEKAGKLRDKIFALQKVMSHTRVITSEEKKVSFLPPDQNITFLLQKLLKIKGPVSKIECYDVSNIQGKFATGSMVVFEDDAPDKNQYRKFKIKMKNEPNDIAMLKEILQRRFAHQEWPMPEVILIDGGKAQLNAALSVIAQNSGLPRSPAGSLAMTVMAIAKGRQELFIEGKNEPIPLKQLPQEIYNLIKQLDDEAHRFAITYHKNLRKKNLLQ